MTMNGIYNWVIMGFYWDKWDIPSGKLTGLAIENMAIELVDLPIQHDDVPLVLYVYQRFRVHGTVASNP